MTTFQKIIKYGAIAFGIYLCIIIITAIISVITGLVGITWGIEAIQNHVAVDNRGEENQTLIAENSYEFTDIEKWNIDLNICKLTIKTGEKLKVETTNVSDKFYCNQIGKELKIKDDKLNTNLFNSELTPEVTIYLPENQEFKEVELDVSINDCEIEKINAKEISIKTGGGKCVIKDLKSEDLDLETGAGESIVEKAIANKLDLESGIGKTQVTLEVLDVADIDSGVGSLEVNLLGNKENYMIEPSVGLGSLTIDNERAENNKIVGNGNRKIEINAGIGELIVNFKNS